MTEIAIFASGTRGDVQPYIALGKGLLDAGYTVRVLTSDNFETLVSEAGLTFCPVGISNEEIIQSDEWRSLIESGNFFKILTKMRSELSERSGELAKRIIEYLPGSDLILTGVGGLGGPFTIADAQRIPVIQAYIYPFTPTSEYPSPLVPNLPFGKALNRLSFFAMQQGFWQSTKAGDEATRKLLGLGKGAFWGPFRSLAERQEPVLYGYSRHILPPPKDWPKNVHVTGYWFLDPPAGWQPPADLLAFLDAGDPPVYIGFGSMKSRSPEEAGEIALEALSRTGQRGVLASGWGGIRPAELPESVHLISSIPHSWLFEHMAAVVHHGGAGTTAAGLHAGVPSVIIPFFGDQPFWGKRIADLGVGPKPIPRKKLTGQHLAEAIEIMISDQGMRQRAARLGQQIRAENGLQNAVEAIDRFIKQ